jgi:hypothetical protein
MLKLDKIIKGFFVIVIGMITPVVYVSYNIDHYNKTNVKIK